MPRQRKLDAGSASARRGALCKRDSCGVREPTPLRTGALSQRLRPLGQTVSAGTAQGRSGTSPGSKHSGSNCSCCSCGCRCVSLPFGCGSVAGRALVRGPGPHQPRTLLATARGRQRNSHRNCSRQTKTAVGFEPTPLRTGAWSQRHRPLGQTVWSASRACGVVGASAKRCLQVRGSIVVSISACHAEDPGSIPGRGV